jgi:glycosyltransferase involved in cell wall biosynthesis
MVLNKRILFVVNVDWFFISHRLILAEAAIEEGYEVTVVCNDTGRKKEIEAVGAIFVNFQFERSGTNIFKEIFTLVKFYKLYKKVAPTMVHHITLKPVIYGSIVARFLKIPVLNAVSGLGFNFTEGRNGFSTNLMTLLMRVGFKNKNLTCIFQNNDDLNTIKFRGILNKSNKIVKIKGAGVDLNKFSYQIPPENEKVTIVLPARLLWDKGVNEFYEASQLLKKKYAEKVIFKLIGIADTDNKAGVSPATLKGWVDDTYFIWVDYQKNMVPVYLNSDIVVLPSYREGMPKTLLEACAVGRPIVTTNAIGCKECVDEGVNGFKVPVKSIQELAKAIEILILDKELRISMGKGSRNKAVNEFNQVNVISKHLEIYNYLSK